VNAIRLGQTRQARSRWATTSEYGLLRTGAVDTVDYRLERLPAADDLSELIERHWLVRWDLPSGHRRRITLLPHPCVNLVFDRGRLTVAGVGRERFTYEYTGRGYVFGVKFRPGAFRPFVGGSVKALTDRTIPLSVWWGESETERMARDLAQATSFPAMVEVAERYLRAHWPPPDPDVSLIGWIVHALLYDRSVTRVDQVAERFGLSTRSLQRLFERYVGVSPKWVLKRYRLHEAAARLAQGGSGTWADVAAELGYFDQSHFIRDFTRAVGLTPVEYARACQRHKAPVSA